MTMTRTQWLLLLAGFTLLLAGAWFFVGGPLLRSFADRAVRPRPRPVITVEATYPGASAPVVADTVAAPIEGQVSGVKDMVSMLSRCSSDGSYTLTVIFKPGEDLPIAQVLVQNRVALALPVLPGEVQRAGVSTRKRSDGVLLLAAVSSPDDSRDAVYLGTYAGAILKDELARVPGVGDVSGIAAREAGVLVRIDRDKLAARGLAVADVVRALEPLKVPLRAGPPQQTPMEIKLLPKTRGSLPDLKEVEEIVLKTTPEGRLVYLKDVARVEIGVNGPPAAARLNGKAVVVLALSLLPQARPREVSAAVGALVSRLRPKLPAGVGIDAAFDFTPNLEASDRAAAPEYFLIDPTFPAGTAPERNLRVLGQCAEVLRKVQGVRDVLTLSDNPFDFARDRACILVRLAPAGKGRAGREEVLEAMRARLREVAGMTARLRDLSGASRFPRCGYPIDLAVSGPEQDRVTQWADKLAGRMGKSEKLTDVAADPESSPQRQLYLDVDRTKAKEMGVSLDDVFTTLQACVGRLYINDFNRVGRTWQVQLEGKDLPKKAEDLKQLKVRNGKGDMVPLGAFVDLREVKGPTVLVRLDGRPMGEITANLAPGVPPAEARSLCERLAEEVRKELRLPREYRLTWLQE
jgi:multidrug efflux pump subunit AcrB